jgi:predicted cobalt transporter CbtA
VPLSPVTLSGDDQATRTFGTLLLRGLLAGLIAGLLAGVFAYTFGEPNVDAAIAIEQANAPAPASEEELVSRTEQKGGLFLATGLYGVAMGGLLAVAYALLRRRLRTADDSRAALTLAGAALVGIVLVPWVKYPPNPPAVGDPSTIDQRTVSYLSMLVIGLVAVWAATVAFRAMRAEWARPLTGAGAFLIVVAIGYALLPTVDEVPGTFPASLLWNFRITSLGTQVVLWTALGLAFGALLTRPSKARRKALEPAA